MKRRINPIIIGMMAAISLLAAACSTDHSDDGLLPNEEREISLNVTISGGDPMIDANSANANTRGAAVDGATNAKAVLTGMTFFRKDGAHGMAQTNFSGCSPITAGRANTGAITFSTAQQYLQNGNDASFVGCWPGTEKGAVLANNKLTWDVPGDRDILISTLTPSTSFNAGNYASPSIASMPFEHALARLQVTLQAKAGMSQDVVRSVWGKITKIEIQSSAKVVYDMATNTVSYTANSGATSLWLPSYSGKFENQSHDLLITPSGVTAEGMYIPSTGTIQLTVYSEKVTAGRTVTIDLKEGSTNKNFERGKTHSVTLTFGANNKEIGVAATTIEAWDTTGGGAFDQEVSTDAVTVGEYYYSDGTHSMNLQTAKKAIGIIYWVNPTNNKEYKILSLQQDAADVWTPWCTDDTPFTAVGATDKVDGRNNTAKIKQQPNWQTRFPRIAYCENLNRAYGQTDWYIPALYELQVFWCAFGGIEPVRTWETTEDAPEFSIVEGSVADNWLKRIRAVAPDFNAIGTSTETSDPKTYYTTNADIVVPQGKGYGWDTRCIRFVTNL